MPEDVILYSHRREDTKYFTELIFCEAAKMLSYSYGLVPRINITSERVGNIKLLFAANVGC
jgi:hypothetical protein